MNQALALSARAYFLYVYNLMRNEKNKLVCSGAVKASNAA